MTDDLDTLRPEVTGLGPCKLCGATGYALSYGGIDICPACDVGMNPEVTKLKRENTELRAELLRLVDECDTLKAQSIHPRAQLLIMLGHANERAEKAEGELRRLADERDELRTAYTSASQSRDYWKECAGRVSSDLAALKARIFQGIVLDVDDLARGHAGLPSEWRGRRVRLVVEE